MDDKKRSITEYFLELNDFSLMLAVEDFLILHKQAILPDRSAKKLVNALVENFHLDYGQSLSVTERGIFEEAARRFAEITKRELVT